MKLATPLSTLSWTNSTRMLFNQISRSSKTCTPCGKRPSCDSTNWSRAMPSSASLIAWIARSSSTRLAELPSSMRWKKSRWLCSSSVCLLWRRSRLAHQLSSLRNLSSSRRNSWSNSMMSLVCCLIVLPIDLPRTWRTLTRILTSQSSISKISSSRTMHSWRRVRPSIWSWKTRSRRPLLAASLSPKPWTPTLSTTWTTPSTRWVRFATMSSTSTKIPCKQKEKGGYMIRQIWVGQFAEKYIWLQALWFWEILLN